MKKDYVTAMVMRLGFYHKEKAYVDAPIEWAYELEYGEYAIDIKDPTLKQFALGLLKENPWNLSLKALQRLQSCIQEGAPTTFLLASDAEKLIGFPLKLKEAKQEYVLKPEYYGHYSALTNFLLRGIEK